MAIELVTQYLPYVDELFTKESKKELLTNKDFKFGDAGTVKIYKISTAEMNDYARTYVEDGGYNFYGKPKPLNATTETMTLTRDRSFTFIIDKLDASETGRTLEGASALARQIREVVIPEVDTYTYGQMCANAGFKPEAITLTADNIYGEIVKACAALDDELVPETGRTLTVTPAVYALMKESKQITMDTEIGQDMRIKGVIANMDGDIIIKLPASRVPENFGFMLSHPSATCAPTKLEDYTIHHNPPGINGELVEGRIVYDAFVLDNKKKGIYYQAILAE